MLILISPAKSFAKTPKLKDNNCTLSYPEFYDYSKILLNYLKKLSYKEIASLMEVSENIAKLNQKRFSDFPEQLSKENSSPAISIFDGDVYKNIDVKHYNKQELEFLNNHMMIISGLYGLLKPFDLICEYRLEMGTALKTDRFDNLYKFWQNIVTDKLNSLQNDFIINLASNEYFSAIDKKKLKAKIINVIFNEKKDDNYKIVGINAKKMRGKMVDYIVENKIINFKDLIGINLYDYFYNSELSKINDSNKEIDIVFSKISK